MAASTKRIRRPTLTAGLPVALLICVLVAAAVDGSEADPEEARGPTRGAQQDDKRDSNNNKLDCKKCCQNMNMSMALLEPDEWEQRTNCRLDCCNRLLEREGRRTLIGQRQSVITSLMSCIVELLANVANGKLKIPQVCCQIPPLGVLPVCVSSRTSVSLKGEPLFFVRPPAIGEPH